MTVTQIHRPSVSVADRMHTAARFVEVLGDPGTGVLSTTVFGDGGLSLQIVGDSGALADRRFWLDAAGGILTGVVSGELAYGAGSSTWGSLRVSGTFQGVAVEIYTALSWPEARELGLAICAGCNHTDHEGDTCLVAGLDADDVERACECGHPDAEAILLAGGAISDFDVAAAQAIAIVNGDRRHEERREQPGDDRRDEAAERDAR